MGVIHSTAQYRWGTFDTINYSFISSAEHLEYSLGWVWDQSVMPRHLMSLPHLRSHLVLRARGKSEGRKKKLNKITAYRVIWSVMSVKWLDPTRRAYWGVIGGGKSEKAAPVPRESRRTSHPLHHYIASARGEKSPISCWTPRQRHKHAMNPE